MSLEDPFSVVKEEVCQSLKTAQSLYARWSAQLERPDGSSDGVQLQTITTELKNCLKSIGWDLQDLDQTITIAENNPHKFRIDAGELEQRKQFVKNTTATVEKITTHLNSDTTRAKMEAHQRKRCNYTMPEKCILLEDTSGHRRIPKKNPLARMSYVRENLLKGSLLIELTDAEVREAHQHFHASLNYKKFFDNAVKLYCMPEQVLQLNDKQFELLLGVKYPFDRYKVMNILYWAEDLKIGYGVNVTISASPDPVKGIIRYIGTIPGEKGTRFGIELLEKRGEGTSDGTLENTKYFKCDRGCAVFVAIDQLSGPNSTSCQVHKGPHALQVQDAPLKLNDGVIFYDQKDNSVRGIVRWIGTNKLMRQDGSKILGIETDQQIIPHSIPGRLHGMDHMFRVTSKGGVKIFLPIDAVLKDESNSQDEHDSLAEITSEVTNEDTSIAEVLHMPKGEDEVLPTPCEPDEPDTQTHHCCEHQVKQLQIDDDNHNNQLAAFSPTVDKLSQSMNDIENQQGNNIRKSTEIEKVLTEIQETNEKLKNQLSLLQQQFLDVLKSNEVLQVNNVHLQNQLSLTQQQLLGVQSMMTCSRLWVVSHDQFTIGREIGRGAWASVHETTFRGAKIAAKRLHDEITSPETIELFHQEMEMALHCQHQNIVTFLGVTLENHPVILMELMDVSLRSAYKRGNVKYQQVLKIFYDIASALHFLHTRPDPVIHRDVSSANVLLKDCGNEKWLAKLGDLGTAKLQQYCTTPGPGALAYAAPEVADPKRHSTKMDVYSFGVLVVEVLTKTLPFQNLNTLKGQVQQQFPQYHQLVTSCTNQQSSDRPTMYDVIGQLNKIKTMVSSTQTCS